jgi:hypothetical protein
VTIDWWRQEPSSSDEPAEPEAQSLSKLAHLLILGLIIGSGSLTPVLA